MRLHKYLALVLAMILVVLTGCGKKNAVVEVPSVSVPEQTHTESMGNGKTKFLFTGDIDEDAQERIADHFQNAGDAPFKVDLMKVPHHGAYANTFYRFLRTFMPKHAVISVGEGNQYDHPKERTLEMPEDADAKVYRTDKCGNIVVRSNGKTIEVETEK